VVLSVRHSLVVGTPDLRLTEAPGASTGRLPAVMRRWRRAERKARADRTHGKTGLTTTEREELARLRKENRILREEREILKKGGSLLRDRAAVRFRFIATE